ncbi:Dual specificity phosphatase, catalytic domain [Singulisphaera sp. GP187]|nr:Dual specificity phosphatase, catalytic domain [Singulisphaera sp. GP187]
MFEPMRYAALFGVLGILLGCAAVQRVAGAGVSAVWGIAVVEGYVALGLLTMALAHGLNDRGIALEQVFGSVRGRQTLGLLLLPYRALARITLAVLRRFDSMELMHPVGPRLFVGRHPSPSEQAELSALGVTSVLNLCAEFPRHAKGLETLNLETAYVPVLDGTAPSDRQFRQAVEWIVARHGAGQSVLVHCAQGRGRSVTVAAAALCRLGLAADPDDALARIAAVRTKARPSRKQRQALARFWNSDRAGAAPSSRSVLPNSAKT